MGLRHRTWFLLATQVVVTLLLLETGLRLLRPYSPGLRRLTYEPISESGFEDVSSLPELLERSILGYHPFQPSQGFVLNSRSLRTSEYSRRKPEGVTRILAIGDSFTFSSGLPHGDDWPAVLGERLAERDADVEVLRLGVPGTSTAFQVRLWQLEGRLLEADAVILGFFIGNDLVENAADLARRKGFVGRDPLARISLAWRTVRNLSRAWRSGSIEPWNPDPPREGSGPSGVALPGYAARFDPEKPALSEETFLRIEHGRMSISLREHAAALEELVERTMGIIDPFHREMAESGTDMIVLLIPDAFQVHGDVAEAAARFGGRRLSQFDLEAPQRLLRHGLDESGIRYLDPIDAFRAAGREQRLYLPGDTHWNAAGNRLAVDVLLREWNPLR